MEIKNNWPIRTQILFRVFFYLHGLVTPLSEFDANICQRFHSFKMRLKIAKIFENSVASQECRDSTSNVVLYLHKMDRWALTSPQISWIIFVISHFSSSRKGHLNLAKEDNLMQFGEFDGLVGCFDANFMCKIAINLHFFTNFFRGDCWRDWLSFLLLLSLSWCCLVGVLTFWNWSRLYCICSAFYVSITFRVMMIFLNRLNHVILKDPQTSFWFTLFFMLIINPIFSYQIATSHRY